MPEQPAAPVGTSLPFTGERFVPGTPGEIWMEHWHRYHFALRWAKGRRVLDVACGEGYGAALLARVAADVLGVDVSEEAIAHARRAYAAMANLRFECAPCTRLPLADGSVEVAVSFETIEHIAEQAQFLDELARVLAPGGVLVLSCPNKREYTDRRGFVNEFHVKELYREELAALLRRSFPESDWYGQRGTFFSVIAPEGEAAASELVQVRESAPAEAAPVLENPLYFLVAAARRREALAATPPALSVLSDRDEWVYRDYEKVMRNLEATVALRDELVRKIHAHEAELAQLRQTAENLRTAIELQETAIAAQRALSEAQQAAHAAQVAAKQHEIDRRRGWRWWLRLPLVRLGLFKD